MEFDSTLTGDLVESERKTGVYLPEDAACVGANVDPLEKWSRVNYHEVNAQYGPHWGAYATYLSMVPRFFHGLHGLIRMLPAIPPTHRGTATCLLLWGLFASPGESSYAISFGTDGDGFDDRLFESDRQWGGFDDRSMLIQSFNALAHARGLRTGFVLITNSGQLSIDGAAMDWHNRHHREVVIGKCVHAVQLGFDSIYFDSIRHADGWDSHHYCGVGSPIPYWAAQELTHAVRTRTGRGDLSCVGEYTDGHPRFQEMGLTAGINHDASCWHDVPGLCFEQAHSSAYRVGLFVSNDNDSGHRSWDERLQGAGRALCTQPDQPRVPVHFTQADLWPMIGTSFHDLVCHSIRWDDGAGHFHPAAVDYRRRMNETFAFAA